MVFRSKVDGKLTVIGLATPCVAAVAIATTAGHGSRALLPLAAVVALVALVVVWTVVSTYYELTHDLLVARSGPFSWRIPLQEISSVHDSDSMRSGPALSMDRLEIVWGKGRRLIISPGDKPGFLAALHGRAPQLMASEPAKRR